MTARRRGDKLVLAPGKRASRQAIGLRFRVISGAILIGALIFAPWCWACTWPGGIRSLNLMLLTATAFGLVAAFLRQDRLPRELIGGIILILLEGWTMTLNSRSLWAPETALFAPLEQPMPGWPGSVERDISTETMSRITGLLGVMLIVAFLGQEQRWRRTLGSAITATGVSIVLLGCCQRWTSAHDIFWSSSRHLDYFFATFRNVTNAGEYLNFTAALAGAALLNAIREGPARKAWSVLTLVFLLTGVCICGSRIAPVEGLVISIVFVLLMRSEFRERKILSLPLFMTVALVVFAVALMIEGGGWGVAQDRWQRLFEPGGDETWKHRLLVDRACLPAVVDAGPFGFGPGSFLAVFPAYQSRLGGQVPGRWLNAHNDYLQAVMEWGWVGTAGWVLVYFGGMGALFVGLRRGGWRRWDRIQAAGLMAALTGTALMACMDFPLQMAAIQLLVATTLGMAWSCFAWPQAESRRSKIVLRPQRLFLR